MRTAVLVECPSPLCPGRVVEGDLVTRNGWEATWYEPETQGTPPYWLNNIGCPSCGCEGIDPESGQLDSAEEELGKRCETHGIVCCPDCEAPG